MVAGCVQVEDSPPPAPQVAPKPVQAPPPRRSPDSFALEGHYARLERDLVSQGLLRQDGGGRDTPFNTRSLIENFIRIALFDEYRPSGDIMVARETESRLRRWDRPIRMDVEFGATVAATRRASDISVINSYAERLSGLTNVPIVLTDVRPNFYVFIVNEDDRRDLAPRLKQIVPGISPAAVRTVVDMPRSTLCLVFAFADTVESSSYSKAIAVIRGEHPELLRLSCIHEELAQGMGLANDSAFARPSIFNDDEEFGLLTNHDELLLKMLYDPRLTSGMTANEARPVVERIAAELMGGPV